MSNLLTWLELLNRKERHWLLKDALGGFSISEDFRRKLSEAIAEEIPDATYVWMDYPFDWIYAALELADHDPSAETSEEIFDSPDFRLPGATAPVYVNANQEDVDLLVAFEKDDLTYLVMIEAKGASSWTNKQLRSKAHRTKVIFDPSAPWTRRDVVPYFVITSPKKSQKLQVEDWFPPWFTHQGRLRWMNLPQPKETARIERWDRDAAAPSKAASGWRVEMKNHSSSDGPGGATAEARKPA